MASAEALPGKAEFIAARRRVSEHAYHTPLLTSRTLSDATGFEVRVKAENLQKTGSYKIRGPLNKFPQLTEEQRRNGVICSSAGNHAQGVALAARIHGMKAVVVMAKNATPSKIEATKAYGAEVVLHGMIWDEANEMAKQLDPEAPWAHPRKPNTPMWFGAVRPGKAYVSVHLMPLYMNPALQARVPPGLKGRMQGKACFNFRTIDFDRFAELEDLARACAKAYETPIVF